MSKDFVTYAAKAVVAAIPAPALLAVSTVTGLDVAAVEAAILSAVSFVAVFYTKNS